MNLTARSVSYSEPLDCEEGFAPLSAYTARFAMWGQGPPIVLVPALAGGIRLLTPLAERLASCFRVIAYDLRGEDDCFALRRRFALPDLVADLDEFLDYMGLERPILCGVSFGGVLALEYAARHARRLQGLIVQGVDVQFRKSLLRHIAGHVLAGYPLPANNSFINQFFNLLFGGRPRDPFLFDFVTRQSWQTDQSVIAHRFRLAEKLNLRGRLAHVRVPTLLLNGERDVLATKAGLHELCSALPCVAYQSIRDAGHLAFLTHTEEFFQYASHFGRDHGWLVEATFDP